MVKIIKAKQIPRQKVNVDDIIAKLCFNYPQYTFLQAKHLPYKRVKQLLRIARKEEARKMFELMQIVAAPNTKKGHGIKKVLDYYREIMEDKYE